MSVNNLSEQTILTLPQPNLSKSVNENNNAIETNTVQDNGQCNDIQLIISGTDCEKHDDINVNIARRLSRVLTVKKRHKDVVHKCIPGKDREDCVENEGHRIHNDKNHIKSEQLNEYDTFKETPGLGEGIKSSLNSKINRHHLNDLCKDSIRKPTKSIVAPLNENIESHRGRGSSNIVELSTTPCVSKWKSESKSKT